MTGQQKGSHEKTGQAGGFRWPHRARIAVVVTCLLETWSEGKGPPFTVQTTALKSGTPDRAAMTWGTYGVRSGVWRLLNNPRCPRRAGDVCRQRPRA